MRGLVLWLFLMLVWFLLAANAPSFFPEWFQALIFGFSVGTGIFGGTLAIYASITKERIEKLKEDLERAGKEITLLKNQAAQPELSKPQSSPPPIETEAQIEEAPQKLLPAALPEDLSNENLKNEALEILFKINETEETIKVQTKELRSQKAKEEDQTRQKELLNPHWRKSRKLIEDLQQQQLIPRTRNNLNVIESQISDIESEVISKFNQDYGNRALQIKNALTKKLPENLDSIPAINYTKIKTTRDLEVISVDLKQLIKNLQSDHLNFSYQPDPD